MLILKFIIIQIITFIAAKIQETLRRKHST